MLSKEMHAAQYRRHLFLFLGLFSLGMLFSVTVSWRLYVANDANRQARFSHSAEVQMQMLSNTIEEHEFVVEALRDLFSASPDVSRDKFYEYTKVYLERSADIVMLVWAPRILDEERASFEMHAREDGLESFQISDSLQDFSRTRAPKRSEYYPAYYVEPYNGNEMRLGMDLSVDPVLRTAMQQAQDGNCAIIPPPETDWNHAYPMTRFSILFPVYKQESVSYTKLGREQGLLGYIYAVFDLQPMAEAALESTRADCIATQIMDITPGEVPKLLFVNGYGLEYGTVRSQHFLPYFSGLLSKEKHLNIAGRLWALQSWPTPPFWRMYRSWTSVWALVIGILLTCLIGGWLFSFAHRNAQISGLVEQRTSQLLESEKRFSTILDAVQTGVVIVDQQSKVIEYANPTTLKMAGVEQEDIFKKPYDQFFVADRPDETLEEGETVLAKSEDDSDNRFFLLRPDGDTVTILKTTVPITLEDRVCNLETFVDITAQKKNESHIKHLNAVLRAIRTTNQRIAKEMDSKRLLQTICDALTGTGAYAYAWIGLRDEDKDEVKIAGISGVPNGFVPLIAQISLKDTACCAAEALIFSDVIVVEDPHEECGECALSKLCPGHAAFAVRLAYNDTVYGIVAVSVPYMYARDIEEQGLFEEVARDIAHALHRLALEEHRVQVENDLLRIRSALDAAADAILVTDLDRNVVYTNLSAQKLFGLSIFDINKNGIDILYENVSMAQEVAQGVAESGLWKGEVTVRTKGGEILPTTHSCTPVLLDNSEIAGLLLVFKDISDQRLLEAQLRQAQKLEAVGQLAAGIAHEINTPSQYVGDNIQFLKEAFRDLLSIQEQYHKLRIAAGEGPVGEVFLDELDSLHNELDVDYLVTEIPSAIEQSQDGVNRISEIVRAMKEFSHPGAEEKTPIDINHAISNTITVARNEWKYVAEMKTDFDSTLPPVPCLPGEFNQVILNLIVNAAQAIEEDIERLGEEKGTIEVKTSQQGAWAEIEITDTGPGMTAEVREHLFDPFFTTKEVGKGTGQGLTIAHNVIVDKHGGSLDVQSAPGEGATFVIRLPLEEHANSAPPLVDPEASEAYV